MYILILGRTKMSGASRCIGGLADDGRSVRLQKADGTHWDFNAPFQVGQIWDVTYIFSQNCTPPHTEDVIVTRYRYVRTEPHVRDYLLKRLQPWQGGIGTLFNGVVRYTANNNGYISADSVPAHSTWFWIPDRDLTLRNDSKHYDYPLDPTMPALMPRGLSYVGEPPPLQTIQAGTLVRVSLARWWKPNDAAPDFKERCYLQLSGWFL